ncbi:type II toxin-antitoxin system VapB family antitoxin [Sporichthya sp.]|uniref:type II toxin-antitoxin system VapB family antitoxin n=1 Tax=Sporichthya sp. TaxID=65475 RepID=UPI0017E4EA44|nr:type II toxin-antitoxin system VapB family antitoxin [Sporichthya sp.]MBA3742316.1 type II toxin-antitoxin system VapB family antitoxin [Sporichthya sp.]
MAFSIKSPEADRLARELAALTGESMTEAVLVALRERVEREHVRRGPSKAEKLRVLAEEIAALPILDHRSAEDIVGYDEHGIPS